MIRLESAVVRGTAWGGSTRNILGPLDWEALPQGRHLILGANGAGKTTLLRVLAGMRRLDGGRRLYRGAESPGGDGHWPEIALLLEEPDPQILTERVDAEVAFGLESMALEPGEVRNRVGASLESIGISALAARDPRELSAGEKARVLLAAALAARPDYLLLDQSLAHLDRGTRRGIESRVASLADERGMAVIRTHQEAEGPATGERSWLLNSGGLQSLDALRPEDLHALSGVPVPVAARVAARLARAGYWPGPLPATMEALEWGLRAHVANGDAGGARSGAARDLYATDPVRFTESVVPPRRAAAAGATRIEFQGVAWRPHGAPAPLLDDLQFLVREGEIVALIGASGSGKTAILRLAAGLDAPSAGRVDRPARDGRRVALSMEYPERMLFGRTVAEDVAVAPWIAGVPESRRREAARRALETVGLSADRFEDRVPHTLSEGEKRRVAIASLIVEPPVLLALDEPTAGLDPAGRASIRELLRSLRDSGHALLLASHDLDFVSETADRVLVLARGEEGPGRIVAEGSPQEIWARRDALDQAGLPVPDHVRADEILRSVWSDARGRSEQVSA